MYLSSHVGAYSCRRLRDCSCRKFDLIFLYLFYVFAFFFFYRVTNTLIRWMSCFTWLKVVVVCWWDEEEEEERNGLTRYSRKEKRAWWVWPFLIHKHYLSWNKRIYFSVSLIWITSLSTIYFKRNSQFNNFTPIKKQNCTKSHGLRMKIRACWERVAGRS